MATAAQMFSNTDQGDSSGSDDQSSSSKQNHRSVSTNNNQPRPGQHLDDADLLAWKHQYMNVSLREQNVLSNSADDLTQLVDHEPFEAFRHDYNEIEDDELHFNDGNSYDYETSIQDRLKKANEELQQDETPVELRHKQRVSFDSIVKAVDIEQEPQDVEPPNPITRPPISPVEEEALPSSTSPQQDNAPHQYTVPLNDTQPKEGPTLLQQLKAMQFHGVQIGERWAPATNASSSHEGGLSSTNTNSNNNSDTHKTSDMTNKTSSSLQRSMVVSINGGFEIQNEDDYTAKGQVRFPDDEKKAKTSNGKGSFTPAPPTEPKQQQDPTKPRPPQRPFQSTTRPSSSDSSRRTNTSTSKSWSDNANKSSTRPKSAGVSKSMESHTSKRNLSGDYFEELNRKAAAEKREREEAERLKQEKAEEERQRQLARAKESFEKWVHDKDSERKRLAEEKRLEQEEHDAREAQCEKELAEKRDKKFQEWIERKDREVTLANEFRKLQAEDESMRFGEGSVESIRRQNQRENRKAFKRWLHRKYEQSREEQRQLRIEARRLRRRQRRSIKRFQLQQDLQLAKSFGYT